MDRFAYIAMTGAREAQLSQAVAAHNLANASTTGFKATLAAAQSVGLSGPGFAAGRAYAVQRGYGIDATPGPLHTTGRQLDVAIDGQGWIAVQAPDGGEAYTRAGHLQVGPFGMLKTEDGRPVLGNAGPIALPPYTSVEIGGDGTISIRPQGGSAASMVVADRIRLVNPPPGELRRGDNGLIRMQDGSAAPVAAGVKLRSGMLEGSNVNPISELVQMIDNARSFEMQIKLMATAKKNDQAAAELLRLG